MAAPTEVAATLCGEVCAKDGEVLTAVKAGGGGWLTSEGRNLRVFCDAEEPGPMQEVLSFYAPSTIYNYEWRPESSDFIVCMKNLPVTLIREGKAVKTYTVLNHVDEVKGPLAASFSPSSQSFWTGVGRLLYHFDLETGANSRLALHAPGLKFPSKTIISAVAADRRLVAIGTYSQLTYILTPTSPAPVALLEGQCGGLIQCTFLDHMLYTAGRGDQSIYAWDLRQVHSPVNTFSYYRDHKTFQRVLFSVDSQSISVGNADGSVYWYRRDSGELWKYFRAHFDAVSSVQDLGPQVVTSGGQRHYFEEEPTPPRSCIRSWKIEDIV